MVKMCCSVVFGTLVGVFVFSVMWSDLLMTSAISCPLWSPSVYECQRLECAFTSPGRTVCDVLYAVVFHVATVLYCVDVLYVHHIYNDKQTRQIVSYHSIIY